MRATGYRLQATGFVLLILILGLLGCDAFVRKFTRKPKKEDLPKEELVLVPEDYKGSLMSNEDRYRQYFMFWQSWQDELIKALTDNNSHKRKIACVEQALSNLAELRPLLVSGKQRELDIYLDQLKELREKIVKDTYGSDSSSNKLTAEHLKRSIFRDFLYKKVNKYINKVEG